MDEMERVMFKKESDELVERIARIKKVECRREVDDQGRNVISFEFLEGKYRIICDEERFRFWIYCEERYSDRGYEFVSMATTVNAVCFKLCIW